MSYESLSYDRTICVYNFESYKRHISLRPTPNNASSYDLVDIHCWPTLPATEGFPSKIVVPVRKYQLSG